MDIKKINLILKLYLKPFLISFGIGIVFYLWQMYGILINKVDFSKIPLNLILDFLYYNLGWFISIAIPSTFLFSTIFVFARLPYNIFYEDFKYERHSFSFFLLPVGVFAILFSVLLFFYNDYVLPEYNYKARNILIHLSRISSLPNYEIESDEVYTSIKSEREMNLKMLRAQQNYFINLEKSQPGKSEAYYDYLNSEIKRMESEIQKRYTISFSNIFFLVFAIPFGFLIRNKHIILILVLGFVFALGYWIIITFLDRLLQNSSPLLMWLPNIILVIIGFALLLISNYKFKKIKYT